MHGRRSARADRVLTPRKPPGRQLPPRQPPPYRYRRRRNIPARIAVTLLVIVALVALYGLGALFYASSRITREPVRGLQRGDVYHVLVTGSDSRENLSREQRNELNTGSAGGERTDTIFVLSVQGSRAAMLAFPRDLFVERCDGSQGRINAATTIDGQGCLVETVSQLSGLPIRHAIKIDFLGFREVVDATEGVDVCLDRPIADRDAGIDLPAGCQRLRGSDALGFVRVRKIDDDLGRIQRQQQFLKALAKEVAQPSTVLNPFRFYGVAGAMGGALHADEGLSSVDLIRLGLGARGIANGRIATETVPAVPANVGGAAVLQVSQPDADNVFERFRSGAIFDEVPSGGDAVAPEDVELDVLNGSGIEGLAGQTAEALEARGFTVREVGNAPATTTTVVRHPEGQEAEARTVAAQAPGGDVAVEADDSVDVVTLILGSEQ
jgi:LCP family protein required for cell wall assembly